MEAKIILKTMKFYASHGCYATEQRVGGRFTVDVTYYYDCDEAVESDDVTKSVSYLDVYETISEQMAITSNTIEHVTSRIVKKLIENYSLIKEVEVTMCKITPPLGGDIASAGVTLKAKRGEN